MQIVFAKSVYYYYVKRYGEDYLILITQKEIKKKNENIYSIIFMNSSSEIISVSGCD